MFVSAQDLTTEQVSHPLSALRGLVTEGSNLLLLRLIARRKTVPQQMTFLAFDQGLRLTHSTVVRLPLAQCHTHFLCCLKCLELSWVVLLLRASWV